MTYLSHLAITYCVYLILALGLNLKAGYAGLLSMSHAAHFAVGAYGFAIASVAYDMDIPAAVAVGVCLAALNGLVLGAISWRLRGDLFVLLTMAFQAVITAALVNWASPRLPLGSWGNMTNGPFGIANIPAPTIAGVTLSSPQSFLVPILIGAALCVLISYQLQRSAWARTLIAIRDDEVAARSIGKTARAFRVQATTISAAFAGFAGALYVSYVRYVDPSIGSLDQSILFLSMLLLGGAGGLVGPALGALVFVSVPEILRFLDMSDVRAGNLRLAIFGLTLIFIAHVRPNGLAGKYRLTA